MKVFLIAQTGINLLAAIAGTTGLGRAVCLGFGAWGGYYLITQYWS